MSFWLFTVDPRECQGDVSTLLTCKLRRNLVIRANLEGPGLLELPNFSFKIKIKFAICRMLYRCSEGQTKLYLLEVTLKVNSKKLHLGSIESTYRYEI